MRKQLVHKRKRNQVIYDDDDDDDNSSDRKLKEKLSKKPKTVSKDCDSEDDSDGDIEDPSDFDDEDDVLRFSDDGADD